ncbi:hypothetical protein PMI05_05837 [Brevibacillus sp. BC25]|nr:hypothetical protein PMI05_05837 [Brevibacillus sp. BC25]
MGEAYKLLSRFIYLREMQLPAKCHLFTYGVRFRYI